MSLKPGISNGWFQKFKTDVYPNDAVVIRGKTMKPPKYYDKLYELLSDEEYGFFDAESFDQVKLARANNASKNLDSNPQTLEGWNRLKVKETCKEVQIKQLIKTL